MTLVADYKRLCATPSDIYEHLPTMVELVKDHAAKHVIELGTRTGVSTIAWLYGLAATGGYLTSVDIDRRPKIGKQSKWTFIQGNDLDPVIVTGLDRAEIVFIDTSHLFEQTVAELNVYRWLVKPGGVIVLHDTMLAHPEDAPPHPAYPVRKAVEQFVADTGLTWTNHPNCNGLGIIEGF